MAVFFSSLGFSLSAQNIISAIKGAFGGERETVTVSPEELYDLTLEENLMIPELGSTAEAVREYQHNEALKIKREHYKVETTRNGEVIIVTIPAESLFAPSDTLLLDSSHKLLRNMFRYLEVPDFYRMLIVMHHDNTGSSQYTFNLTRRRIEAVFNWFESQNVNTDYVIPYAMGDKQPLKFNTSFRSRQANRRLEIYLVPGTALIAAAKKGNLK